MSSDAVNKLFWGPKLWKMFHLAAEFSDRRDIILLWKSFLKWSAEIIPCELCRKHLSSYLYIHEHFSRRTILSKSGKEVRMFIRMFLLELHNDVNRRLEKPEWTEESLTETYGVLTREQAMKEIKEIYNLFKILWQPLVNMQINGSAFTEWKKSGALLIALISSGSN
jgi:hypothetical protein